MWDRAISEWSVVGRIQRCSASIYMNVNVSRALSVPMNFLLLDIQQWDEAHFVSANVTNQVVRYRQTPRLGSSYSSLIHLLTRYTPRKTTPDPIRLLHYLLSARIIGAGSGQFAFSLVRSIHPVQRAI